MESKKTKLALLETTIRIQELLEILISYKEKQTSPTTVDRGAFIVDRPIGRRVVHMSQLVLQEGEWLMNTVEALTVVGCSRGTLDTHRDQGLITDVKISKQGAAVRFISSEVLKLREWYSVRKGKV